MKKRIYRKEDHNISTWSGGITKELAVFPPTAKYLERDFIWRLSSATVDAEESTFTRLQDYDRILMVLDGEAVLAYGDERSVNLKKQDQDSFDGAVKTKCFGKIRDYNLMMRKGCTGRLESITAESEAKCVVDGNSSDDMSLPQISYGFYCTEGYMIVLINGETTMIKADEQLVVDLVAEESPKICLMGDGKGIMSKVSYDKDEHIAEEIPAQSAGADDFKAAFKLTYKRHRWNQVMSQRKSNVWYDEILQKKLRLLEKTYATLLIWFLGAIIIICLAFRFTSEGVIIAMVAAWTALHILLIAPLIYMIVLPKPIKAHMKDVSRLTGYERRLYEKQLAENEVADRILKRYKFSGRNEYINDDESKPKKLKK